MPRVSTSSSLLSSRLSSTSLASLSLSQVRSFSNINLSSDLKTELQSELKETGVVLSVIDGVARVSGLENVFLGEVVKFKSGDNKELFGLALNLEKSITAISILGTDREVSQGDMSERTRKPFMVPTGDGMIGRVVNCLGEPVDGLGPIKTYARGLNINFFGRQKRFLKSTKAIRRLTPKY